MKNLILFLLIGSCIVSPGNVSAQLKTYYYNDLGLVRAKRFAHYYITVNEHAPDVFETKRYSREDKLELHAFYSSMTPLIEHGYYCSYHENGNKASEGYYEDGHRMGEWKTYHDNGKLMLNEKYENGTRTEVIGYYASGILKRKEYKKTGEQSTGECYNENGNLVRFFPYEVRPVFNGDIAQFIQANMKYPEKCRNKDIEGRVVVKFKIDKRGHLFESEIMKSAHPILDKEALRVVRQMKDWTPGLIENEPAICTYALPISFRLQ